MIRAAWAALALALAACGGGEPAPVERRGPPIGMSEEPSAGGERVAAVAGSVELALRRADGTFIDVGELRGGPVVLVVIATFDGTSQMLLRPLREVAERHPELTMIGIAAEPSARLLIAPYESALSPPFTVTYDPEEQVREGSSALGAIDTVPTVIVLGADGVEVARASGFMRADALEALVTQAL